MPATCVITQLQQAMRRFNLKKNTHTLSPAAHQVGQTGKNNSITTLQHNSHQGDR